MEDGIGFNEGGISVGFSLSGGFKVDELGIFVF